MKLKHLPNIFLIFRGSAQSELAIKQAILDQHVFKLHEFLALRDPVAVLRFLDIYGRRGDNINLDAHVDSVLGHLKNAGYDGSVRDYDASDPQSFAKFAASSLIRDMQETGYPPSPTAINIKVGEYQRMLSAGGPDQKK